MSTHHVALRQMIHTRRYVQCHRDKRCCSVLFIYYESTKRKLKTKYICSRVPVFLFFIGTVWLFFSLKERSRKWREWREIHQTANTESLGSWVFMTAELLLCKTRTHPGHCLVNARACRTLYHFCLRVPREVHDRTPERLRFQAPARVSLLLHSVFVPLLCCLLLPD